MLRISQSALRALKIASSTIVLNKIVLKKKRILRIDAVIQLNDDAECNIINEQFAVVNKMKKIFSELSQSSFMNDRTIYYYEVYLVRFELVNNWQRQYSIKMIFYVIDKKDLDLVIDTLDLIKKNIKQNWKTNIWRWEFIKNTIKLIQSKEFIKALWQLIFVYVVFVQSKTQSIRVDVVTTMFQEWNNVALEISEKFKNFEDVFSKEQANIFVSHQINDHVIELEDKELSYESLYNLSIKKLKILREYIDFILTKKWIQHFINSTKASILFVLKKNDKLKLCVDYREFNKMTRKNRHLLLLITQILNQLNESKYFNKIDLKNVYHHIKIHRDDE